MTEQASAPQSTPLARTDEQIVADANDLARRFYEIRGYVVPEGYRFDQATHPHEVECWQLAVEAYGFIDGTEVLDALEG